MYKNVTGVPGTSLARHLHTNYVVARKLVKLELVKLPTEDIVKLVLPESLEGTIASLVVSGAVEYCRIGKKTTVICLEKGKAAALHEFLTRTEDQ